MSGLKVFNFEANGVNFGDYLAVDLDHAREVFAHDAGYGSWISMVGQFGDDFIVTEKSPTE